MGDNLCEVDGIPSSSSVSLSSLELSDTKVYEPQIRALLGTAAHFCEVVVLKLRTVPIGWQVGDNLCEVDGVPVPNALQDTLKVLQARPHLSGETCG